MTDRWVPLVEYSTKYQISVSTLRRKIRGNSIEYKIDAGKYFILDENESDSRSRSQRVASPPTQNIIPSAFEEPQNSFSAAHKILEELKKAYSKILQEKEEQILELKEEIADLRTLVRVLESENVRLSSR